jgi:hypothetical protein
LGQKGRQGLSIRLVSGRTAWAAIVLRPLYESLALWNSPRLF